ncbi:basement membrane-specific heparan sulfate proteoglycan core protein-like isoform X6 [Thunnus maccoyii]|uniref:basement membrane-specific heparan sulfate proteoglycan core protein-like isoform X6 n=1 Tax=Thunnus maccoyii TaxID=8240 RepID=UPI001C4C59AF|nr:basement membrane-specific heparan sulfate proteoglycan core protein-like isoform X6 [Thunnus maccoyii]
MRMNICSCLLALVLGCNVTAEIIHQIVKEEQQVSLHCSHSVEGKVTWSREINGNTVDILIADGDGEQRFNDSHKRYSSLADKSLHISRVALSDSGKYLCNNEAAVELTVIPSGTTIVSIAEKSSVTLTCPDVGGSHVPTWTREIDGKRQQIRHHVSAVHKYLNIPDVQPGDSGLYYCDGKPAANLNVIKGDQSEREDKKTPISPTTTSTTSPPAANTEMIHQIVEEKEHVFLHCSHSVEGKVTWSREINGNTVDILTVDGDREQRFNDPHKRYSSLADKSLLILKTALSDSGKYLCNNKAAVELTVIPSASPYLWRMPVRVVIVILYLILMISITVTTWRRAQQIQKQHTAETENHL